MFVHMKCVKVQGYIEAQNWVLIEPRNLNTNYSWSCVTIPTVHNATCISNVKTVIYKTYM